MNYHTFKTLMAWSRKLMIGIRFVGNGQIEFVDNDDKKFEMHNHGEILVLRCPWKKTVEYIITPRYLIDLEEEYTFVR